MTSSTHLAALALLSATLLAACGGNSDTSNPPPAAGPTDAERAAAASATAQHNPLCSEATLGPYYWELGDRNGVKAAGTVGAGAPTATTDFNIASASKWVYGAYVMQKVGVRDVDRPYLNFTSGYNMFRLPLCAPNLTVAECAADSGNDELNPDMVGKFFYDSGHMQVHADRVMGLGSLDRGTLTLEVESLVGDIGHYTQTQLAGGIQTNATVYGAFLRRILTGELAAAKAALGINKVCTNAATCVNAVAAPVPDTESWNYSLGHWVEDDPAVGDHAYSSTGAFGFYPWISQDKTLYGVLAREVPEPQAGYKSVQCGRLIRRAWVNAAEAIGTSPTP